jgi:hypothetical protein
MSSPPTPDFADRGATGLSATAQACERFEAAWNAAQRPSPGPRRSRPQLEALEDRDLPTATALPMLAPNGHVKIFDLHDNGTIDDLDVDPRNPAATNAFALPMPGVSAGATVASIWAGTDTVHFPMLVVRYSDGNAYEWLDMKFQWIHLSSAASFAAAGENGNSVTVDTVSTLIRWSSPFNGLTGSLFSNNFVFGNSVTTTGDNRWFNIHNDKDGRVIASFQPPLQEQAYTRIYHDWLWGNYLINHPGASIVQISMGTADSQGNAMVDALFSDGNAWSWNLATGTWQFLGGSVQQVAAGLQGASAMLLSNNQLELLPQGAGSPTIFIGNVKPGAGFDLGVDGQGGPMLLFATQNSNNTTTLVETDQFGNQHILPIPSWANHVSAAAGDGGVSALIYSNTTSGASQLWLHIDNPQLGGVLDFEVP